MFLGMKPAYRLLGLTILAASALSLLLWIYVAMRIVTCDLAVACYIDWYSPFFTWFPYISFLETGLIAFVASFTCMVIFLTFWWRKQEW